jgi:DNA-binding SARP family transcriptional activator/predicted ATPase
MTPQIKLSLLGPFRAERAGAPLTDFKSNKVRALLAYLALERAQPHHRDVLAGLLWPQSTNANALALLRDALSNLRLLLGDRNASSPCLEVVGDTLQFRIRERVWLDVVRFESALRGEPEVAGLERAAALYRGDLLEGFTLGDGPEFETWLLLQRERYRRDLQQALYRLTTHYLQERAYTAARETARRQLVLEPYGEAAHRQLLRALALAGKRNRALAHYAEYRTELEEDLGVAPDVRTTTLYRRIRDGRLAPAPTSSLRAPGDTSPPEGQPFVGREEELARLEDALRAAERGAGQVCLITGEAGSGKTRLLREFVRRGVAGAADVVAAWGTGNAQVGAGDPYLPFREILRLLCGDFDDPGPWGPVMPALAQRLEALTPAVAEALRSFGPDLVGSLLPAKTPPASRAGHPRRAPPPPAAICDQAARVLLAVTQHRTLVLVLDNLHWADDGSLNLLMHLSRLLIDARILLLASYRPAEAPPALRRVARELQRRWGDITLDLDRAAGRAFVDAYLDSAPNALGPAFRERLYHQTGGHALFTEALVQQLRDSGALRRNEVGAWIAEAELDWGLLPPQVEAVIAGQVARLPEGLLTLLSVASVEGETFTAEVVAQTLKRPADTVREALSGPLSHTYPWVDAQGLARVGNRRVARYRFHHALFQGYLYAQLDPVQRARWHEAVGIALETLHAGQPDAAARLVYHFEAAELPARAVRHLTRAGAYAYRLSAPGEAIRLYRRGLALLEHLPASEARMRAELALQMGLEMPLFVTRGWGAPERAAAMQRAHVLARRLEDTARLLPILRALADVSTAQARHERALAYAKEGLALSQRVGKPTYEVLGYRMTGTGHYFLGHYREARAHLEDGLACYDALLHSAPDSTAIPDVSEMVFLWAWLPHVLCILGYPDQAAERSHEALALVDSEGPAHAQAKMLIAVGGAFHAIIRQPQAAIRYSQALLTMVKEHNLPAFKGWAIFYRGWGRATLGETSGLEEMNAGLERLQATGTEASLAHLFTLLAESYADAGQIGRSGDFLARALRRAEETGARSHLAEMYRLRGTLCAAGAGPSDVEEAEAWFLRAIDVAQAQAAKLWELRATVSLARFWQSRGRAGEAYARLAEIDAWFTEGFDAPDLVAARALLAELAGAVR